MKQNINPPEQNVISTLSGKKVLFLENDNSLEHGLHEFENILKRSGIEYTVLFELDTLPIEKITESINEHDVIVFMTQWVYEIAQKLFDYIKALPKVKTIVEVYINEPSWYYKRQHGSKHDVYIYTCQVHWGEADKETERFYKLTNKPYWDYKNKFNK